MIDTILAWLATYLIHSSALILAVWGFTRWCSLDPLTRSLLWMIALVGGLFTASLQTGLGVQPALGQYAVGELPPPSQPPLETVTIEEATAETRTIVEETAQEVVVLSIEEGSRSVTIVSLQGDAGPAWAPIPVVPEPPPATTMGAPDEPPQRGGAGAVLVGLFLGGAILGLGRLAFTARRLRRLLHGRTDLLRGPLSERLAVLLARARLARRTVRLTMSPALVSPIALASREIVVPEAATELEARQQEAMLAHELAHVVRRDPAWLVLAAVIEAALFIQPLNRLARAGMQAAAEELADDWAVRHLGTGLHLARCLTEVASWQGRGGPGPFVSGMASGDSSALVHRVQRLLDDRIREGGPWAGVGRLLAGAGLLAAVAWGAPGLVGVAQASPEGVEVPEIPELPAPPEPPLADGGFAPMLMQRSVSGDSVAEQATEPTARQKRMLRRAARADRKADKQRSRADLLRAQGGAPRRHVVIEGGSVTIADGGRVVIVDGDEHGGRRVVRVEHDADEAMRVRHLVDAEHGWAREEAREHARAARRAHLEIERMRPEIEAMQREAEALARRAPHFSAAEVERLEADARRLAAAAGRLSAEDLRHIEEAGRLSAEDLRHIEDAARIDAREIERAVREAVGQAANVDEGMARRIEAEVRRELGKIDREAGKAAAAAARAQADRDRAQSDRDRAQAARQREQAIKDRAQAAKQREQAAKDRERATKQREQAAKQREQAAKAKAKDSK